MKSLTSYQELLEVAEREKAVAFYISTPACGVCKSLKPKVVDIITRNFPKLGLYYVDAEALPEVRGQLGVYNVPVVLVYFQGRETIREARNFGIMELGAKIERPYQLLFGDDDGSAEGEGVSD